MPDHCPKVPHIGVGYMHEEDDDGPFVIDGVTYCGRCHLFGCPSIDRKEEDYINLITRATKSESARDEAAEARVRELSLQVRMLGEKNTQICSEEGL